MTQSAEFNLTSSTFKADPYPTFARLRAAEPVYRYAQSSNGQDTWLITSYSEADAILRNECFVKDLRNTYPAEERPPLVESAPSASDLMSMMMTDIDPPDHTRL